MTAPTRKITITLLTSNPAEASNALRVVAEALRKQGLEPSNPHAFPLMGDTSAWVEIQKILATSGFPK